MAPPHATAASRPKLADDVIFEILSRLPTKTLCQFRCVSRGWRALIADPIFLAAHKSRAEPLPLLVAPYCALKGAIFTSGVRLMDMDGKVVRDMEMDVDTWTFGLNVFDGRICLVGDRYHDTHLIDLATGELLCTILKLKKESWMLSRKPIKVYSLICAGHVALSGKLKVVRLTQLNNPRIIPSLWQTCEVLEASGGDSCSWRTSQPPPTDAGKLCYRSRTAAVDGVVHFLTTHAKVLRFDLETEQWMKTVRCPPVEQGTIDTRVTELNGALCMVAHRPWAAERPCIDIWWLDDPDKSTWVKAYTVPTCSSLMPLMVTPDGGKILFSDLSLNRTPAAVLLQYDLRDETWNVRTLSNEIMVRLGICRLHLEHL